MVEGIAYNPADLTCQATEDHCYKERAESFECGSVGVNFVNRSQIFEELVTIEVACPPSHFTRNGGVVALKETTEAYLIVDLRISNILSFGNLSIALEILHGCVNTSNKPSQKLR